ncbi:MAG TPA: hypothetical protein VF950_18755 [Planctomycetota bacterium]
MDTDKGPRIRKNIQFWGELGFVLGIPGVGVLFFGLVSSMVTTDPFDHGAKAQAFMAVFAGLVLYCGALAAYARHKGRSFAWGLMGLSCVLGLIVLRFLPKRCRGCERACRGGTFDCPGCGAPI